jgi:hypothetical protein
MILPKDSPWGDIRGRIKTTPEEALKNFNFVVDPSKTYPDPKRPDVMIHSILFRGYTYIDSKGHRKKGTFISNYMPATNRHTDRQNAHRAKMRAATLEWHELMQEQKNEYNKQAAKLKKKMSGFCLHNREYILSH